MSATWSLSAARAARLAGPRLRPALEQPARELAGGAAQDRTATLRARFSCPEVRERGSLSRGRLICPGGAGVRGGRSRTLGARRGPSAPSDDRVTLASGSDCESVGLVVSHDCWSCNSSGSRPTPATAARALGAEAAGWRRRIETRKPERASRTGRTYASAWKSSRKRSCVTARRAASTRDNT
jgi:hypothetical protein